MPASAAPPALGVRVHTHHSEDRDGGGVVTRHNTTAFSAVRISPDGESLAWYRPESDDDAQPWLVITEDPIDLGVEHNWAGDVDVADWTDLQDPDAVRADDALLADVGEVVAAADPVPADLAGLAERVRRSADVTGGAS